MTTDMPVKPVALTSLTLDQIVAMVRTVASERPERIALAPVGKGGCSYVSSADDPEEGCVIGVALARLGVQRALLARLDYGRSNSLPCAGGIGNVLTGAGMADYPRYSIEHSRFRWLQDVQNQQDNGNPWGRCIESADRLLPNV